MDYEEGVNPTPQLERAREAFNKGQLWRTRELITTALIRHKSISLAELEEYQSILADIGTRTTGADQANCARLAAKVTARVTARRVELGDTSVLGNEVDMEGLVVLPGCLVLGGHGLGPRDGETWHVAFTEQALVLRQAAAAGDSLEDHRVGYDDMTLLDVGGPGETSTGGGFIGGGIGGGFATGMMAAAIANALTTKTSIDTVITVQTRTGELFLHTSRVRPDALRLSLSPIFTKLRALHESRDDDPSSVAGQLSRMAELLEKGLIDEDEFQRVKADLLARLG